MHRDATETPPPQLRNPDSRSLRIQRFAVRAVVGMLVLSAGIVGWNYEPRLPRDPDRYWKKLGWIQMGPDPKILLQRARGLPVLQDLTAEDWSGMPMDRYFDDPLTLDYGDDIPAGVAAMERSLFEDAARSGVEPELLRRVQSLAYEYFQQRVLALARIERIRIKGRIYWCARFEWEMESIIREDNLPEGFAPSLGHVAVFLFDEDARRILAFAACG